MPADDIPCRNLRVVKIQMFRQNVIIQLDVANKVQAVSNAGLLPYLKYCFLYV